MDATESFGHTVRVRRRELDLTQEELARRVGVAAITLRKIEADNIRPSQQIAERLAIALDIAPDEQTTFIQHARGLLPTQQALTISPDISIPLPTGINTEDLSGQTIRGYELGEKLGSGRFGVVYAATQPLMGREVAVKIVRPQYANDPDFIRNFGLEAQRIARLEHPYIVPLYDYWREPGFAYLVMRLLRGGNLHQRLEQGPLSLYEIKRVIEQIGEALYVAHRENIIHRDLQASNVLFDEDGNAYLTDFGIAELLDQRRKHRVSLKSTVDASLSTNRTKQRRRNPSTVQTDIYGLGLLLQEMLVRFQTFKHNHGAEDYKELPSRLVPLLTAQQRELPIALERVVQQATAANVSARYSSVLSLVADVQALLPSAPNISLARTDSLHGTTTSTFKEINDTNPYKGLRAFGEADVVDFYGREVLVQQLVMRMGETSDLARFLAVVGPSGSGKSSVVHAGLIPALRRGGLADSEFWFFTEMIPGSHPIDELSAALKRIAVEPFDDVSTVLQADTHGLVRAVHTCLPADRTIDLVLVIDQFEEIFTLVEDESERSHFLNSIVTAVLDPTSRLRVVITLQADLADRPLQYVDFGELVRYRSEFVLPLTPDELERAIVWPAKRAGLQLEDGLATTIIRDVSNQPGTLPLLQFALTELFERRDGQTLTKQAYERIGGVSGALARRADAIYTDLDPIAQAAVRQVFLRLVALGEGTEDTRRRGRLAEFDLPQTAAVPSTAAEAGLAHVIERYIAARILTLDRDPSTREPTLEVAHEALIRSWRRLRYWVDVNREALQVQRRIAAATIEWRESGRDASFLASGARLAQFVLLNAASDETGIALNGGEQEYLRESLAERDRQALEESSRQEREVAALRQLAITERQRANEKRRLSKRLRRGMILGTLLVFVLVAIVIAAAFLRRNGTLAGRAAQQAGKVRARALSVLANNSLTTDPQRSLLLSLQAVTETYSLDQSVLPEAEVALHRAVNASHLRSIRSVQGEIRSILPSPQGERLAVATKNNTSWQLVMVDAATGVEQWTVPVSVGEIPHGDAYSDERATNPLSFSRDGSMLAVNAVVDGVVEIRILDAANGHTRYTIPAEAASFDSDGTTLVGLARPSASTKSWRIISWRANDGKLLGEVTLDEPNIDMIFRIRFSPDARHIVLSATDSSSEQPTALIVDAATGKLLHAIGDTTSIRGAAVSPDGALVAYVDNRGSISIIETVSGVVRFASTIAGNGLLDPVFSPNGRFVATTDESSIIHIYDSLIGAVSVSLVGHHKQNTTPVWSADSKQLMSGEDNQIYVWDAGPSRELPQFIGNPFDGAFKLSLDGTHLTTIYSNTVSIYNAENFEPLHSLTASGQILDWTISADNQQITTLETNHTVRTWDVANGKQLHVITPSFDINSVELARDGTHVLSRNGESGVVIWDLATGARLFDLSRSGAVNALALSPDGRFVVTAQGEECNPCLWNATNGERLAVFNTASEKATGIAFSSDSRLFTYSLAGGLIELWDIRSQRKLFTYNGHKNMGAASASFSRDGTRIVSVGGQRIKVWNSTTGELQLAIPIALSNTASFSSDGSHLIVGTTNNGIIATTTKLDELIALARKRLLRGWTLEECQQFFQNTTCPAPE